MTINAEYAEGSSAGGLDRPGNDGLRRRTPRTFLKTQQDAPPGPDASSPLDDEDLDELALDEQPDDADHDLADHGEPAPTYAYEAVACQVSLGPDDDAFASTLVLTGDDDAGEEVSVWMRLTPTLITRLTQQLTQVYRAQQAAMGLPTSDPLEADDDPGEEEDDEEQEGLIRRASDPLGLRFLRDRPASFKWLALAIGSLLVISLILRATVFG